MNANEYAIGIHLASATGAIDSLVRYGAISPYHSSYLKGLLCVGVRRWIRDNRNGGHCEECGGQFKKSELQRHHIIPRSEGGDDMPWNLQLLCADCHNKKHGRVLSTGGDWNRPLATTQNHEVKLI
jgi:5-methylcytosine-specific restriction endonuclease McrA